MTVTMWTPRPVSAFRYDGKVDTSVLPSPVFISAIEPRCRIDAADHLDVVVALARGALGRLAHRGKGLGQQVVEGSPLSMTLAEVRRAPAQGGVGERNQLGLELIDLRSTSGVTF